MMKDFKAFLLRGNVVDLAVAVVIGAAFTGVVNSFVKDIITPFIAAIIGQPDFSHLQITINGSVITYGSFLNAVIAFVLVASVIFFFVVQPMNQLVRMTNRNSAKTPEDDKDPQLVVLEDILDELKRQKK